MESSSCATVAARADLVVTGVFVAVADVVGDGVRKQHRLLRYEADASARILLAQMASIDAVDLDASRFDIAKARDQAGALSRIERAAAACFQIALELPS